MHIGIIGLGKMGANMARRLMRGGHECVVYDLDPGTVADLGAKGAITADSLEDVVQKLPLPAAVWIMVPDGAPTDAAVQGLGACMQQGDIIIDGGNSLFKDDVRRAAELQDRGIHYVDVGTSGGVWGLERGYCLMIGGAVQVVKHLDPIFRTLAPGQGDVTPSPNFQGATTADQGYLHCGPVGAGHFVKMIHNGIEYGLMQAYAEGFDILRNADSEKLPADIRYDLPLGDIAELWRRGSVVGSWLLDLTSNALNEDPNLSDYSGHVSDSGEGRWTVNAAIEEAVPAEVITAALFARFRSRQDHTFAEKITSAMRHQFGGHVEVKA